MNVFLRLVKYVKPYWKALTLGLIASLLYVAFNSTSMWLSASFLEVIFSPEKHSKQIEQTTSNLEQDKQLSLNKRIKLKTRDLVVQETPADTLKILCIVVFIMFFFKNIFRFFKRVAIQYVQLRLITDLRDGLYSHLHTLSLSYFDSERSGEISSILINDVLKLRRVFTITFNKLIVEPLNLLAFIVLLFIISWKLTLFSLIILPVSFLIISKIGHSVRRKGVRNSKQIAGIMSILNETLQGIRIVKAFAMEQFEKRKFFRETQKYFKLMFRLEKLKSVSSPLNEIMGSLLGVGLLWLGGNIVLSGSALAPEDFVRFIILLFAILTPIRRLNQINLDIQRGIASGIRIFSILDEKPTITEQPDAVPMKDFQDKIEYRDVWFAYNMEDGYVLEDINMEVNKGDIVAFVGSSGAGKSTLVDLLPRFYDPQKGEILIDGKNIQDYTIESLRQNMGMVTQEVILFNDTIFNNIAYGIDNADMEQVRKASRAANALDFIESMPKGYDTMIGEKGVKLSGGQRQRLSIARALMKNPPILILDEATSSLDTESEQKVQEAINELMRQRTTFVIAHRLSTITEADIIYVLEDGRIVESGTHDELIEEEDSRYSYYYELQFNV
jgi:subfamily B ATP-binding cassette protein MsbA